MAFVVNRWMLYAIFPTLLSVSTCNQTICPQKLKFEALPGQGFDTIRNREMGRVFQFTYDDCRTTEDGRYLVPDDIYDAAIKDSQLQTTSEYIGHYLNYTSLTSQSLKANVGFNVFGLIGVQASFDEDFMQMKKRQIEQKSITTRIQMRNDLYLTEVSPSTKLDPGLKSMITQACRATDNHNFEKSQLICQLIVRNYGTHYVYQAHAGAILLEEDYVSSVFTTQAGVDRLQISMAAGASFFKKFAEAKFSFKVEQAFQEKYESYKTSSLIRSIGGAIISSNMTVDDWIKEIGNNLVVIDRVGNPLSFLVTPEQFPEFSINTLNTIRQQIDQVVKDYYSYNTHHGCTDVNSPNFDFNANVDNGKCSKAPDSYYFGAGYLTCHSTSTDAGDLCEHLNVKNPLTGDYRCEDGFEATPLTGNTLESKEVVKQCSQKCSGWWFWKKCWVECVNIEKKSAAVYNGFWCVAKTKPANNTGVMFGGLYTSWMSNPMTRTRGCPLTYVSLTFAPDLQVCVSDTYDIGFRYSAPFGGFFSCQYGNPLTIRLKLTTGNKDPYLHACPDGYSQRMAIIDNGCEVNYCVKLTESVGQIDVVLPPFRDQSALFVNTSVYSGLDSAEEADDGDAVSGWSIAGAVILVLVVLALVVVVVVYWRRRRSMGDDGRSALVRNENPSGYGAIGGTSQA